jgi:drug/metabolite transporter (DMT)-like permease
VTGAASTAAPVRPVRFGVTEWAFTALTGLIWGASFLFIRIGVDSFGAGLVPAMRIAFGALALGSLPAARRPIAAADWPTVALLGVVWMALPFLLFSLAERTVPTAITGMINGAVPLSVAVVDALWRRRVPSAQRAVALLLGLGGVALIAQSASRSADGEGIAIGGGVVMLLVGVVCYGVAANVARPLQRRYGSLSLLVRVQAVGLVASLPYAIIEWPSARPSWPGLGAMLALGALGTGLAYAMATTLVGRTDATRGTIGVFLTPVVATVLGVSVRHESLPPLALVGAVIVLGGAVLTSRPEPGEA